MINEKLYLFHNGAQVSIPMDVWNTWEDRMIQCIKDAKCFRLRKGGSYTLTDPGRDIGMLTSRGREELMLLAIPEWQEMWQFFHNKTTERDAEYVVTKDLIDSKRVKKELKAHIKRIKQDLMESISAVVDNECGLPVKFTFPPHAPSAMYYTYGDELFHVVDILDADNTTRNCGKFA